MIDTADKLHLANINVYFLAAFFGDIITVKNVMYFPCYTSYVNERQVAFMTSQIPLMYDMQMLLLTCFAALFIISMVCLLCTLLFWITILPVSASRAECASNSSALL